MVTFWLVIALFLATCALLVVGAVAFPPGRAGPKHRPQHRERDAEE